MSIDYIFKTYNQLNKKFEVHVMLINNQYQFKLVKRLDGNKPPRHPTKHRKSKFDILIERIDKIDQRIDKLEKIVVQDHNLLMQTSQLLHKIIKLNNLKTK